MYPVLPFWGHDLPALLPETVPPKVVHTLIPKNMCVREHSALNSRRTLAAVLQLRDETVPSTWWAQCHHEAPRKREAGGPEKRGGAPLPALKLEQGVMSQETQVPLEAGKGQEMDFPQSLQKERDTVILAH